MFWDIVPKSGGIRRIEAANPNRDPSTIFTVEVKNDFVWYLKDQTGMYLSRIHRLFKRVDYIEAAKSVPDVYCEFTFDIMADAVVTIKSDTGKYLCRVVRDGTSSIEAAKYKVDDTCKFNMVVDLN